jgi:hypothetical protein
MAVIIIIIIIIIITKDYSEIEKYARESNAVRLTNHEKGQRFMKMLKDGKNPKYFED